MSLISLVILGAVGWLWYAGFVGGGMPGWHWPAVGYSYLFIPVVLLGVAIVYSLPGLGGVLLVLLIVAVLVPRRRRFTRRFAFLLGMVFGGGLLLLIATAPAAIFGYEPQSHSAIAPWHKTYRTIYSAPPFDDNYGALVLLECGQLGLCRGVYRGYTDIFSAASAWVKFNPATDQIALNLNGEWAYVRSREATLCVAERANPITSTEAVTCDFSIEN